MGCRFCIGCAVVCSLWIGTSNAAQRKSPRIELLERARLTRSTPTNQLRRATRLQDKHVKSGMDVRGPIELLYQFSEVVAPEQLSLQLDVPRGKSRVIGQISILASNVSPEAGFQALRADVVKSVQRVQKFRFVPVAAKWLIVRISPMGKEDFRVGELTVQGRRGKPTTHYKFKESPAKSVKVLQQLKRSLRVSVSRIESELFVDAEDGKLDRFSFAEASLIASGVTNQRQRKDYLRQIDQLESQFKQLSSSELEHKERGRALLQWLHEGAFKGGYRSQQTRVSTILDKRTYNCVSSATLYNILGRRFRLDLRGIEVPTHAFSILYVDQQHFDVETTSRNGFAPARNSAVVKELRRKNGLHYIPDRYRHLRREVDDMGMVALIYYNRGVTHARRREFPQAIVAYFGALSLDQEFASAVKGVLGVMTNWSLHLARRGNYPESLKVVDVGLKLAPQDARLKNNHIALWQEWARKELDRNRLDQALAIVRAAQQKVPHGPFKDMETWVFTRPGEKFIRQRKWQSALRIARTGLKKLEGKSQERLNKWRNGIYLRWGNHEMSKRRFAQAVQAYARGLEMTAGKDRRLNHNLGYITYKWAQQVQQQQGLEEAIKLVEKQQRSFSEVPNVHQAANRFAHNLILDTVRRQEFQQSLVSLEKLKHLFKNDKTRLKLGGYIFDRWARSFWKKDRQWAKAIEIYRQGLKQFPNDRILAQNLKFCQAKQGTTKR